ncbi:MAG: transposase, partial [Planctomycetota bacterium]|nr:transposase [Planctomycetota bacterium]
NRRQKVFFSANDYHSYLELMVEWCRKYSVDIWAYCLMPNHIHLIAVPSSEESLARAIGEAHRRYTRLINFRKKWRGYLWQGRFASFPMAEQYLYVAARYIELNPVRAGLVKKPEDYEWSSAKAHISGKDDELVKVKPLLEMIGDWHSFLSERMRDEEVDLLRRHERTGRPLGSKGFIKKIERLIGKILHRQKPGPKK